MSLDIERLEARLCDYLDHEVSNRSISGCVTGIYTPTQQYIRCFGKQKNHQFHLAEENDIDMSVDTIFRGASMTKAITSMAGLLCVEYGLIHLKEPVSKYIPEFSDLNVLIKKNNEFIQIPSTKPLMLYHLFNHTSGLSYGLSRMMLPNDELLNELSRIYRSEGVFDLPYDNSHTSEALITALSRCPLAHEPGEGFTYSLGLDILGIIIERASGLSFPEFLKRNIFEPLNMVDTSFVITPEKEERLVELYEPCDVTEEIKQENDIKEQQEQEQEQEHELNNNNIKYIRNKEQYNLKSVDKNIIHKNVGMIYKTNSSYSQDFPDIHKSGGGGLLITLPDYMKFLSSLIYSYKGIKLYDETIALLGYNTSQLMFKNSLPSHVTIPFKGEGWGFSYGFCVCLDNSVGGSIISNGSVYWSGVYGPTCLIDLENNLIGIFLIQKFPFRLFDCKFKFHQLVSQAIIHSNIQNNKN